MYLNGVLAATGCEGATFFPRKSVAETSFRSNKPLRATTVPDGEKRSEEELRRNSLLIITSVLVRRRQGEVRTFLHLSVFARSRNQ
jgi:hypothetical protein